MHGILFLRDFEVAFFFLALIPSKKIFYQCLSPCSFLLHVILCMCYMFCVCLLFLKEFAVIIPY